MAVVWPRNLTKIPDQHTDEIISIFFFFGKACVILLFQTSLSPGDGLKALGPRGWQFDRQRRRGRSGRGGAIDTGSLYPSALLPSSGGGALWGHLWLKIGIFLTFCCCHCYWLIDWFFFTLKVADYDLVVIWASEEMMGSRGEAHRSNVATVGAVCLHDAPPFNVIQHAGAVLLTRGQQAAAGVHCHWGHRTSCLRGAIKRVGKMYRIEVQNRWFSEDWQDPDALTHLSRAERCPQLGHSWALAGPRTGQSCPGSQKRSSTLPT